MPSWPRIFTAMVTPFKQNGELNEEAVPRIVDHLLASGTEGLVVCGTTGESPTLRHEEKLRMFSLVREAARGRAPLLAGTGSNSTAESIRLSREAAEQGADGLLLVTPYYNKPSQEGLYRHFRAVAEAVDLPVMLYNVPPRTSVNLEASTCLRLARDVPNIVAVKEASGNLTQAADIVTGAPEGFRLYSGDDILTLPLLAVGGYGVVSVTAHVAGRDVREMHERFFAGDYAGAARLHARMLPLVRACFQPTTPSPAPVKAALNLMGLPAGPVRLPLVDVNEAELTIVRRALTEYGLL